MHPGSIGIQRVIDFISAWRSRLYEFHCMTASGPIYFITAQGKKM